jgi:surface antigen
MNRPHAKCWAWALGLAAAVGLSSAQATSPWSWLKDTPASRFTEQDWALMRAAHAEALEHGADGTETRWENPQSGNTGSITPLNTTEGENGVCREARIVNRAGNASGDSTYVFCRQGDGSWMVQRQRSEPQDPLPLHDQE